MASMIAVIIPIKSNVNWQNGKDDGSSPVICLGTVMVKSIIPIVSMSTTNVALRNTQLICTNVLGQCIEKGLVCDDYNDCGDMSDEMYCGDDMFQ